MGTALRDHTPLPVGGVQWTVWGCTARVLLAEPKPAAARAARSLVEPFLAEVEAACSRFRADAEIHAASRARGRPVPVSPLLAELVSAALEAAGSTDGDVDPTIEGPLFDLGYDRDFADLASEPEPAAAQALSTGSGARVQIRSVPGWRQVRLVGDQLTVPAGVGLDLGATAKALAADRCAALVAQQLDVGVLVSLGGDLATAGPAPDAGWRVLVQDRPGEPPDQVRLAAGMALATSSTIGRSWYRGLERMHHIVDPRTGRPVETVWRTVTVAARTCLTANTYSTAALVRGRAARSWLLRRQLPARLVGADRQVLRIGGWPAPELAKVSQ